MAAGKNSAQILSKENNRFEGKRRRDGSNSEIDSSANQHFFNFFIISINHNNMIGFFLSKTGTILASINGQGMTLEIKGDLLVGCAALRLSENGKRKRGIIV